jgi:hypothetical protein
LEQQADLSVLCFLSSWERPDRCCGHYSLDHWRQAL